VRPEKIRGSLDFGHDPIRCVCVFVSSVCSRGYTSRYAQSKRKGIFRTPVPVLSSSENRSVLFVAVLFLFFFIFIIVPTVTLNHLHPPFLPPHPANKPKSIIDQWQIALTGLLVLRKYHKVLLPDPAQPVGRVVLVLRKPQLALLCDDVEDLALYVGEVRIATFLAGFVDVKLEQRGTDKQHGCGVCGGLARQVAG
jgi:hypothetical protein